MLKKRSLNHEISSTGSNSKEGAGKVGPAKKKIKLLKEVSASKTSKKVLRSRKISYHTKKQISPKLIKDPDSENKIKQTPARFESSSLDSLNESSLAVPVLNGLSYWCCSSCTFSNDCCYLECGL